MVNNKPFLDAPNLIRLRKIWSERDPLSEEAAGAKMGMTQSAVNQYLNGYIELNINTIVKFARLLKVYPSDIDPALDWNTSKSTK